MPGEEMDPTMIAIAVSGLLFLAMLLFIDIGYRIGRQRKRGSPETSDEGSGTVDAAVFGLLGLILAFTFSGASNRLDVRRAQIVQESNAIGTAYLRLDLLPAADQPALRKQYKDPMSPDGEWRIIHLGEAKYFPKGFGYINIPGASPIGGAPGGAPGGGMGSAILPGGVSGIAIILNYFAALPVGALIIVLNVPVFLLGLKTMGKRTSGLMGCSAVMSSNSRALRWMAGQSKPRSWFSFMLRLGVWAPAARGSNPASSKIAKTRIGLRTPKSAGIKR